MKQLYMLVLCIILSSCTGDIPTQPERNSPYDGRNPNIVPEVVGIDIESQNGFTNDINLTIRISTKESTEIKLGEVDAQNQPLSASWQANSDTIYHLQISNVDGKKWIGCQVKAFNDRESAIRYASVKLDTRAAIETFDWSSSGRDTLGIGDNMTFTLQASNDVFGAETDGSAELFIEDWEPITLTEQGNGRYGRTFTLTANYPNIFDASVSAQFVDRLGNRSAPVEANQTLNVKTRPIAGDERTFPLEYCDEDIVMVWVPSGSFNMGSPNVEADRWDNEGPIHTVTFTEGFWMGKYEITQCQWVAVINSNPSHDYGVSDNHPVYYVSWNDIQVFEEILDNAYRLPSESEWEYACRAGTTTRYYWGDDDINSDIDSYAVYSLNDPGGTSEIGTKLPNAWGLFDMSGNVYEWCEDWYHSNYNNAPEDGSAWISPSGSYRIARGGGWDYSAGYCRSANRDKFVPSDRHNYIGFRLVRDAD